MNKRVFGVLRLMVFVALVGGMGAAPAQPAAPDESTLYLVNPLYGNIKRYVVGDDELTIADVYRAEDGTLVAENLSRHPLLYQHDGALVYRQAEHFVSLRLRTDSGPHFQAVQQRLGSADSLEKAKALLASEQAYDALLQVPAFTAKGLAELLARPDLRELERAELLALLERRQAYGELLSAYLAQHTPRNMRGFARRATQNMFYKDVLRLGYNPYAEFDGDPFARFSQDDEIQQRLHTPIATAAP